MWHKCEVMNGSSLVKTVKTSENVEQETREDQTALSRIQELQKRLNVSFVDIYIYNSWELRHTYFSLIAAAIAVD